MIFYLKKGKGRREGVLPVYVRLTVNGKRMEWSVQQSCEETKWNRQMGRMNGTKEEAKKLNLFLDAIQAHIYDVKPRYLATSLAASFATTSAYT